MGHPKAYILQNYKGGCGVINYFKYYIIGKNLYLNFIRNYLNNIFIGSIKTMSRPTKNIVYMYRVFFTGSPPK